MESSRVTGAAVEGFLNDELAAATAEVDVADADSVALGRPRRNPGCCDGRHPRHRRVLGYLWRLESSEFNPADDQSPSSHKRGTQPHRDELRTAIGTPPV